MLARFVRAFFLVYACQAITAQEIPHERTTAPPPTPEEKVIDMDSALVALYSVAVLFCHPGRRGHALAAGLAFAAACVVATATRTASPEWIHWGAMFAISAGLSICMIRAGRLLTGIAAAGYALLHTVMAIDSVFSGGSETGLLAWYSAVATAANLLIMAAVVTDGRCGGHRWMRGRRRNDRGLVEITQGDRHA